MRVETNRDSLVIHIETEQDQAYVLDTLGAEAVPVPPSSPFCSDQVIWNITKYEKWFLLAEVEFALGKPSYITICKKKEVGDD